MAISATDVVAPVFTPAKVVVLLPARVAAQARFRNLFGGFVLEGDDLLRIAFLTVGLARTMARLATRHLVFPTADFDELRVRGVREGFELILVAVFTSFTADIVFRLVCRSLALHRFRRVRRTVGTQPNERRQYETAK